LVHTGVNRIVTRAMSWNFMRGIVARQFPLQALVKFWNVSCYSRRA
jgi:hypothetical protein